MPRKSVMIDVTADLIELAKKANSSHCMIADAIIATIPGITYVSVDLQTIRYSIPKDGERHVFLTPLKCQEKLLRFDQGSEVKPWSFKLPSPMQVTPITAHTRNLEKTNRPTASGPRVLEKDENGTGNNGLVIRGGKPPKLAVLSNARGQRRVFGIRAAKGFNPYGPDID